MTLQVLFDWLLNLISNFALFLTFLTTEIPNIGLSPLDLISFNGIVIVIGFLSLRLVVGG